VKLLWIEIPGCLPEESKRKLEKINSVDPKAEEEMLAALLVKNL
jgi:hypothetical protein